MLFPDPAQNIFSPYRPKRIGIYRLYKKKHVVAWEQFKLPIGRPTIPQDPNDLPVIHIAETDSNVSVIGERFQVSFTKNTGYLSEYIFNNRQIIKSDLIPHFWRAPLDNDLGNLMHTRTASWKNVDKELTLKYFQRSLANNVAKVKVITEHKTTGSRITMTYRIYGNGLIDIQHQLKTGNKRLPELPRFGMKMTLPKDFN